MEGILLAGEFLKIDRNICIIIRARSKADLRKIEAVLHASSENIYSGFNLSVREEKELFEYIIEKRLKHMNESTED